MKEEPTSISVPFKPVRDEASFLRFIGEFTNYERMRESSFLREPPKLERMSELARELDQPQKTYPSVHVAGTKGKGTTVLMLEALLRASGYRVGSYTSPHVENLRERIRLSGESIQQEELNQLTNSILPVLENRYQMGPSHFPTFFELMTALAMLHFKIRKVDWAIFEVGLGGRLDATNILEPCWSLITSIGLEHTSVLGESLALIAGEKAGIVKPSTPVVLGELAPEARQVILDRAAELGAPVTTPGRDPVVAAGPGRLRTGGPGLSWPPREFPAGTVRGPALRSDLCLALSVWRGILHADGRETEVDEFERALATLRLPARVEVFPGSPAVVIDGAHTTDSLRALTRALEEIQFPRPRGLVVALAADKPLDSLLDQLPELGDRVVFTLADSRRGRDPGEIAARYGEIHDKTGHAPALVEEDPLEALQLASQGQPAVVVTGSFYLAGTLRGVIKRKDR